jgi:hypothetical protein
MKALLAKYDAMNVLAFVVFVAAVAYVVVHAPPHLIDKLFTLDPVSTVVSTLAVLAAVRSFFAGPMKRRDPITGVTIPPAPITSLNPPPPKDEP